MRGSGFKKKGYSPGWPSETHSEVKRKDLRGEPALDMSKVVDVSFDEITKTKISAKREMFLFVFWLIFFGSICFYSEPRN